MVLATSKLLFFLNVLLLLKVNKLRALVMSICKSHSLFNPVLDLHWRISQSASMKSRILVVRQPAGARKHFVSRGLQNLHRNRKVDRIGPGGGASWFYSPANQIWSFFLVWTSSLPSFSLSGPSLQTFASQRAGAGLKRLTGDQAAYSGEKLSLFTSFSQPDLQLARSKQQTLH